MRTFTLNGITYNAKPFDYNLICDLEDQGVNLEQAEEKPLSMIRAYIAACSNKNVEFAGKQIEAHLIGGGELSDIMNAMTTEMNESDFFRAITKNQEKKTSTSQRKQTKKTE